MISCSTFTNWDRCSKTVLVEVGIGRSQQILHLMQINVSSIKKHCGELGVYLRDALIDIDIIILTEINIEATETLTFHFNKVYVISARRQGRKSEGMLAYIKKYLVI